MKIYVEVSKDRKDLFDDSDEFDIGILKREIEAYYGFETNYRFDPIENSITFFNKTKVEKVKRMLEEVLG